MFKKLIPPIILEILKKPSKYGYFGNYKTWQEALNNSIGYDSTAILEKVKNSLIKVKNGEAVYERDSVLFNKIEYSWPVLAGLLWAASQSGNKLTVLDFGGSLGSSYFQNRNFLEHVNLKWYIVEQENFVSCGKKFFENEKLKFINNIDEAPDKNTSVFLASSSLPYIENPYKLMEDVIKVGFPYIIIDRTPFLEDRERITVQNVRPGIYEASYPAWFLNEKKFLELFKERYEMLTEFETIRKNKIDLGDRMAYEKGFIFKIR